MAIQECSGNKVIRWIYCSMGILCVALGVVGTVIPLLPTTPFLILAAMLFSKSSARLHKRLLENRVFGGLIRDWESYGIIPVKAKLISTFMMLTMVSYPIIYQDIGIYLKSAAASIVLLSAIYIWSRPSKTTAY